MAGFTALLLAVTGCELEMEGGPEPAATLVITIAPIPADIPEYDRDDWKHWVDAGRGLPGRPAGGPGRREPGSQ